MSLKIPDPENQVAFAKSLALIRDSYLQDSLRGIVKKIDIPNIDRQLADIVPHHSLAVLAGHGLRGELFFPVPCIIESNPKIIAYYRLLYGFSQKEFYKPNVGGKLKNAEKSGKLSKVARDHLPVFCRAMAGAGSLLLTGISTSNLNAELLDDLTLLTLGPQLRGGQNVEIGTAAINAVFGVINEIVQSAVIESNSIKIELRNAAERTVLIEFAADPDIIIREKLPSGAFRHVIAIEVKGGRDFSNVHNRIGEAEKSHQKARAKGYTECWTVINVDKYDEPMAKRESPSTDRFYLLSELISANGAQYDDFRGRVTSLAGIK